MMEFLASKNVISKSGSRTMGSGQVKAMFMVELTSGSNTGFKIVTESELRGKGQHYQE